MSLQYDAYLKEHISNVYNGYLWILGNISSEKLDEILPDARHDELMVEMKLHDKSKYSDYEYVAYDAYFYGPDGIGKGGKASDEVQKDFDFAWLHHIHMNPHHWQYWVLIEDDPNRFDDKGKPLDIPDNYILEMICDWWSFSWKVGNLHEIFNWWNDHKDKVIMSDATHEKVEKLLELIREVLVKNEDEKLKGEWVKTSWMEPVTVDLVDLN